MNNHLRIGAITEIPADFAIIELDGDTCQTLRSFYEALAKAMDFPDDFGFTLDSLDELLNDLSWIEDEKLAVFIKNSTNFLIKERNFDKVLTLLDLLEATCEDWKWADEADEDAKELVFYFEKSTRAENLLMEG